MMACRTSCTKPSSRLRSTSYEGQAHLEFGMASGSNNSYETGALNPVSPMSFPGAPERVLQGFFVSGGELGGAVEETAVRLPQCGNTNTESVEIGTGFFLGAESDVADFDAELAVDRESRADRPDEVAFRVVGGAAVDGGFAVESVADAGADPEAGAEGVVHVRLCC